MHVESKADLDGDLLVISNNGQMHQTIKSTGGKANNINFSHLPKGNYFLQYRDRKRINSAVVAFVKM